MPSRMRPGIRLQKEPLSRSPAVNVVFEADAESVRRESPTGLSWNVGGRGQELILIVAPDKKFAGDSIIHKSTRNKCEIAAAPDIRRVRDPYAAEEKLRIKRKIPAPINPVFCARQVVVLCLVAIVAVAEAEITGFSDYANFGRHVEVENGGQAADCERTVIRLKIGVLGASPERRLSPGY